jgi:hypothetical protein
VLAALPPFKAQPVSDRVLQSSGDVGVPRIKKIAPTVPQEFRLLTAEKAAEHALKEAAAAAAKAMEDENTPPAPRPVDNGPRGPTVPVSPNITKPSRKRKSPSPPSAKPFKAREKPLFENNPFSVQPPPFKPLTQPEPFNLHTGKWLSRPFRLPACCFRACCPASQLCAAAANRCAVLVL